jgi:hypothetical protein
MLHLHPDAIRIEIDCPYSTTGLMSFPGPSIALTTPQLVTAAVFAHEDRCGRCDTERAYEQGDRAIREQTDRAWDDVQQARARRYAELRRD